MKELTDRIRLAWKMFAALALMALRVRTYRRKLMFTVSLGAMLMAFLGMMPLDDFLTGHALLFALYWLVCGAMVILMILLALYDMMMVKSDMSAKKMEEMGRILREVEKMRERQNRE